MQWNKRFVAALHGDVDGSDVATAIAATRPLYTLKQQVADRRLDGQLKNPREPWRVLEGIGAIAAPLWVADTCVALAQSLLDAEAQDHPQAPAMMSRDVHQHALALLALVEPIMDETSRALADPSYRMDLRMPVAVGIHGGFLATLGYAPMDPIYLRGLLIGAGRAQGSASAVAQDYKNAMQGGNVPAWVGQGYEYVDGQISAAGVRLDSLHARTAPLLAHQRLDDDTLQALTEDCWGVIDGYVLAGQLANYPRLIPGLQP